MAMMLSAQSGKAGRKNIMSMALSPTMTTANQRAGWLPTRIPPAAAVDQVKETDDHQQDGREEDQAVAAPSA
jgi:hypothetical protein